MTLGHGGDVEVPAFKQSEHTAVDKAINVLSAFPPGDRAVGVTELAQKLGLPKTTVFRALKVLERHGLVETVDGRYRLGHRLFELGKQVYRPGVALWETLLPLMLKLCETTRESVALGVLRNHDPVVIGSLWGTTLPAGGAFRMGTTLPAHCTALGKALIAGSSTAADAAVLRGLDRRTPHTIVDPARLRVELSSIRRDGLSYEHDESTPGCSAVALALLDAAGRPTVAISVFGRSGHFDARRAGHALRQARAGAAALLRGHERRTARPGTAVPAVATR